MGCVYLTGCGGTCVQSFIEEAVVRRELADNFCFYQPNYDSLEGAAGWAKETLETHRSVADPKATHRQTASSWRRVAPLLPDLLPACLPGCSADPRAFIYSLEQLEQGK